MEAAVRYLLLAAATVAAGLLGYLGYVLYPRFGLPAGTGAGLLLLAAGAGIASFFSPCSFPLLLSILAGAPGAAERAHRRRTLLVYPAALAAGAALFLLAAGAIIAAAGTVLFEGVTFTSLAGRIVRAVVGALLIALGLIQLGRLRVSFRRFEPAAHAFLRRQASLRRERPAAGFFVFGFGYVFAGVG
jgi:cytochrome c biogenesis protein CcdA